MKILPRYVTIDLFGKVNVGKTTIFKHFVDPQFRHLQEGGNLSYDFRMYFARCWVLPNRWEHSMVFLCDPKFDMKWKSLDMKLLMKNFEPTNILMIVTDSTPEDVDNVKNSFSVYPKLKIGIITFVIANMQDKPGVLSVEEIKKRLEMEDVLGLVATEPDTKEKVESFLEKAVYRYFLMLSKRGQEMQLVDEKTEIELKTIREQKKTKYSERFHPETNKTKEN